MTLTAAERTMRARAAAYAKWAQADLAEVSRKASEAWWRRFERKVDPDGVLSESERTRRAQAASKAQMTMAAYKSAQVRRTQTVCSWCHPKVAGKTHKFCDYHSAQFEREFGQVRARHAGAVA